MEEILVFSRVLIQTTRHYFILNSRQRFVHSQKGANATVQKIVQLYAADVVIPRASSSKWKNVNVAFQTAVVVQSFVIIVSDMKIDITVNKSIVISFDIVHKKYILILSM
jgi:hypothetical protein